MRVLQTAITRDGELILTGASTLTSTPCRRGGRLLPERHGVDEPRLLRPLPILGRGVSLRIRPKRFRCPFCNNHPTSTPTLAGYAPKALPTKACERHLIVQLVNCTFSAVAANEDGPADALLGIRARWIARSVAWDRLAPFATLGIDAIALLKGRGAFVAVISAGTEGGALQVLVGLADRVQASGRAWLKSIPAALRRSITPGCTDSWAGYITAVQAARSATTMVLAHFHVARH